MRYRIPILLILLLAVQCTRVTEPAPAPHDSATPPVTDTVGVTDTAPAADTVSSDIAQADGVLFDAALGDTTLADTQKTDIPSNPVDVVFDAPCEPSCEGKVCGPDGCGSLCGYCAYPTVCDAEGLCVDICSPQCDGKFCGPDGCSGTCGECAEGLSCGEDGLCYEPECKPDCTGNLCGPDGCGGDCGVCSEPKICGLHEICGGGLCCGLGPCGTVDEDGQCQENTLVWCENKTLLVEQDCTEFDGFTCQFDPVQGKYTCAKAPECTPSCDGKVCGSDGCGDICGVCTKGWNCELGACKPDEGADCGTVTQLGQCEGKVLWFCTNGKLYKEDCTIFNETCGFIPGEGVFGCK